MWILPNQRVIQRPKALTLNRIQHPAAIFSCWTIPELAAIGIKPFQEEKYNQRFYRSIDSYLEEVEGIVWKRHTTKEKYTMAQVKKQIGREVLSELKQAFFEAKNEIDFLAELDPGSTLIADLNQYKVDLKIAYQTIRNEILAITDYAELTWYAWGQHYPVSPLADEDGDIK